MKTKVYRAQWPWEPIRATMLRNPFPGLMVAFDGVDGAGKSTLACELSSRLIAARIPTLILQAPSKEFRRYPVWKEWHSGTKARRAIHELGLNLMALGDRLILQQAAVIPALQEGRIIIFDRYILSTLAHWSTPAHRFVAGQLIAPDLGYICSLPHSSAITRLRKRNTDPTSLIRPNELRLLSRHYDILARHYRYNTLPTHSHSPSQIVASIVLPSVLEAYRLRNKKESKP